MLFSKKRKIKKEASPQWEQMLLQLLGIDENNTDHNALSNATYYACLKMLSEAVGKMPLKILQQTADGGIVEKNDSIFWNVLHNRPNRYTTSTQFWSMMEYNRNHYGNAYALIGEKYNDIELYILHPPNVTVWYDNAKLIKDIDDIYYVYNAEDGRQYFYSSEEIIHVKNFNAEKNCIIGRSVRDVLQNTIESNINSEKLLNKLYKNGFTDKAALQYTADLSEENEEKFLRKMQKFINGDYEQKGVKNLIPIPPGVEIKPLNTKLADSQFIELKQYSALQVAAAFGIKPIQIGDFTKSSYASAEAQQLSFLVDTLLYIIKQYEEEITYKLLDNTGTFAKFNVDVILRADFRNKVETLTTAINSFLMTPNEARKKLDLPNKEGGDILVGNGSSIPITDVGQQYRK